MKGQNQEFHPSKDFLIKLICSFINLFIFDFFLYNYFDFLNISYFFDIPSEPFIQIVSLIYMLIYNRFNLNLIMNLNHLGWINLEAKLYDSFNCHPTKSEGVVTTRYYFIISKLILFLYKFNKKIINFLL